MSATAYLPHPEPGPPVTGARVARHYLEFTETDTQDRVAQHVASPGSPLVAAIAAGGTVTVERTRSDADRNFERAQAPPQSATAIPRRAGPGHTNGRGLPLEQMPMMTRSVQRRGVLL
jgi:hypothetical protein